MKDTAIGRNLTTNKVLKLSAHAPYQHTLLISTRSLSKVQIEHAGEKFGMRLNLSSEDLW